MRNKQNEYIVFWVFLGTLFVASCNMKEKLTPKNIEEMYQKNVVLDLDKMLCRHSRVDTLTESSKGKMSYTFVQYVDSNSCSPCLLDQMYIWNELIDKMKKKGVSFAFIFEPKNDQLEDVLLSVESSGLRNPVFIDTAYIFRKHNSFIPRNSQFHSFLLDERGKVLFVGNPLDNSEVEKVWNDKFLR